MSVNPCDVSEPVVATTTNKYNSNLIREWQHALLIECTPSLQIQVWVSRLCKYLWPNPETKPSPRACGGDYDCFNHHSWKKNCRSTDPHSLISTRKPTLYSFFARSVYWDIQLADLSSLQMCVKRIFFRRVREQKRAWYRLRKLEVVSSFIFRWWLHSISWFLAPWSPRIVSLRPYTLFLYESTEQLLPLHQDISLSSSSSF